MEEDMIGVNKAILIGNLGRDPEVKKTPGGTTVATFSLATTERYTDKSGERQERTEWHNIVAWSKLAELVGQYLKKGSSIYVEGRITTRSWDDRDGNKKYRTEVVANTINFLSGTTGSSSGSSGGFQNQETRSRSTGGFNEPTNVAEPDPIAEDDLPF
jgi:single-strand DNA-binding protein